MMPSWSAMTPSVITGGPRRVHADHGGELGAFHRATLLPPALSFLAYAGFATASLGVDADSPTGAVGIYQPAGFTVQDIWIAHLKPLLT
jgi:hypothetical protein